MLELTHQARKVALAATLLFPLAACGEDPEAVGVGTRPVGAVDASVAAVCGDAAVQTCACPGEPNAQQYCYNGQWSVCGCSTPLPTGPVNTAGSCKPGRYEGNFGGLYFSGFSPGGIPVPVIGVDLSLIPPLVITIEQSSTCTGLSEFCTYGVSDGYVKGTADGIFPFEGKITGSLDCSTKLFSGTFDGWYALVFDLGVDLNKGYFTGPITAVYDAASHSFKQGTWNVKETRGNPVPGYGIVLTELGGGGDWQATYNSNTVRVDAGAGDAGTP